MFNRLKEEANKVQGGLSDNMTIDQIAEKHGVSIRAIEMQIEKGKKIEMEHTDDPNEAERVAMDHLVEFPDYYDRLKKMEKEAEEEVKELNEAMLLLTESEKEIKKELDDAKKFFGGEKISGIDTNRFIRI
jgi:transcriptional antiterminator